MPPAPHQTSFGLTSKQAQDRLRTYGENLLPSAPLPSPLVLFISQIKNPLVYVLLAAALITLLLGDFADLAIILLAIILNTLFGFVQERKALHTLASLSQLLTPHAKVIRDGKRLVIPATQLVPGDLVILNRGDQVPADGLLVFADDLYINEAILTGESTPCPKTAVKNLKNFTSLHQVCMGTFVTAGVGHFIVQATGPSTRIGAISQTVSHPHETSPLRVRLASFTRLLTLLILGLSALIFLLGLLLGLPLLDIALTAVALAVAAIPEGLLVALTLILALAASRIARHRGLVKHLLSAETLGSVTTICADKTGTLTAGEVKVTHTYFTNQKLGVLSTILVNDLHNPLEQAMWNWGNSQVKSLKLDHVTDAQSAITAFPRLDEIPFASKTKFIATLNQIKNQKYVFVSGAPEIILSWTTLSQKEQSKWQSRFSDWATQGARLVGFAYRPARPKETRLIASTIKHHLTWLGLIIFDDPVRPTVASAIKKALSAGIKIKIITGDYPETASAVLSQVGLRLASPAQILTGSQLEKLSPEDLQSRLHHIVLFARTTPEQKLKIVTSLKAQGEIVAMTGDGVNDAPALAAADIGIVVSEATDLAKETADMVLLDSDFSTIIHAIEEGRAAFANFRKIVLYLLADAFAGILLIFAALLARLPLPLTAAQILWINFITDGFPSLALTLDPKEPGLMNRPPTKRHTPIIDRQIGLLIALVSSASGLLAFVVYIATLSHSGSLLLSRSFTFLIFGTTSLFYSFSCRSLTRPLTSLPLVTNRWLILAFFAGLFLLSLPFYFAPLHSLFRTLPLSVFHWGIALTLGLLLVLAIEITKLIFAKLEEKP